MEKFQHLLDDLIHCIQIDEADMTIEKLKVQLQQEIKKGEALQVVGAILEDPFIKVYLLDSSFRASKTWIRNMSYHQDKKIITIEEQSQTTKVTDYLLAQKPINCKQKEYYLPIDKYLSQANKKFLILAIGATNSGKSFTTKLLLSACIDRLTFIGKSIVLKAVEYQILKDTCQQQPRTIKEERYYSKEQFQKSFKTFKFAATTNNGINTTSTRRPIKYQLIPDKGQTLEFWDFPGYESLNSNESGRINLLNNQLVQYLNHWSGFKQMFQFQSRSEFSCLNSIFDCLDQKVFPVLLLNISFYQSMRKDQQKILKNYTCLQLTQK